MGSGQQRCNYEVSRANSFENDPREARGEVLFALKANPPGVGEPFDEACTHWEKGDVIPFARLYR